MATTSPVPDDAISITAETLRRPDDEDLDLFGLTHAGKVRTENQDQFLVATVHPQVVVHGTSLPNADALPLRGTRLATLLVIADGVGGTAGGKRCVTRRHRSDHALRVVHPSIVSRCRYIYRRPVSGITARRGARSTFRRKVSLGDSGG